MKNEDLLFEILYRKCINEWPRVLELNLKSEIKQTIKNHPDGYQLINCEYGEWNGDTKNYVISGLMNLEDQVDDKFKNSKLNIIFNYLNAVISSEIGNLSIFLKKIFLEDLRNNNLKIEFERRLIKYVLNDQDPGWDEESIEIAKEYFRVNYPEGHPVLEPKKIS